MKIIKPTYRVRRLRNTDGTCFYKVHQDNGAVTQINKKDKFYKPVGRHHYYHLTLRDAIMAVAHG